MQISDENPGSDDPGFPVFSEDKMKKMKNYHLQLL